MDKKLVKPLPAAGKSAKSAAQARAVDALFSRGRQRVLTVLYANPQRSYYANEIIALAQVGTGGVQRELASLANAGLLRVSRKGNQKHFQANAESRIAADVYALVQKTLTQAGVLGAALAPFSGGITRAWVHGTPDELRDTARSDIAVVVVSDALSADDLGAALAQAATALERRIALTLGTAKEIEQLKAGQELPRIWLAGSAEPAAQG